MGPDYLEVSILSDLPGQLGDRLELALQGCQVVGER